MMIKQHMSTDNDRAISPVIGVVLMVGIVVAIGAVVGAATLGIGVGVGDTAPQAQFDTTYNGSNVTITHVAGDTVDTSNIEINGESGSSVFVDENGDPITTLRAGETVTINIEDASEVTITWESGETTSILFSDTVPESSETTTESFEPSNYGFAFTDDDTGPVTVEMTNGDDLNASRLSYTGSVTTADTPDAFGSSGTVTVGDTDQIEQTERELGGGELIIEYETESGDIVELANTTISAQRV